ncbi:hypothetical protein [Bradyrhizobium ganzhouense]|uniref:hypothetical protein n=1 Tax=Bradyrhizobium ganzhouense TaxID=1179767 RepID=UPI003CF19969
MPIANWSSRHAGPQSLWFREDDEAWIILDRGRQIRTGCSRDGINGAAKALETYIGERHNSTVGATDPSVLAIADVLTAYEIAKRPKDKSDQRSWAQHESPAYLLTRPQQLFWQQDCECDQGAALPRLRRLVDRHSQRQQQQGRRHSSRAGVVSDQTARRRLEDLRAAINAYHAEHTLSFAPRVTLPIKTDGQQRWLTRNEAARLLAATLGYVWDGEKKTWKRENGRLVLRERWIINRRRRAARFILVAFIRPGARRRSGGHNGS